MGSVIFILMFLVIFVCVSNCLRQTSLSTSVVGFNPKAIVRHQCIKTYADYFEDQGLRGPRSSIFVRKTCTRGFKGMYFGGF